MKKPVLFDFGNVLYTFDYSRFVDRIAAASPLSSDRVREVIFGGEADSLARQFETGRISADAFFSALQAMSRHTLDHAAVEAAFVGIFEPIESTLEVVRDVATRAPVGLVSNTNEIHFEKYMKHIDVFPLFSAVALSYVTGAMKPDPAIYVDAVRQLGVEPRDCWFVDDLQENVDAARALGMTAIRYRPGTDLRVALGID